MLDVIESVSDLCAAYILNKRGWGWAGLGWAGLLIHPLPTAYCSTATWNLVLLILKIKLVVIGQLQHNQHTIKAIQKVKKIISEKYNFFGRL